MMQNTKPLVLQTADDVFSYFEQFMNLERMPSLREYKLQRMQKLVEAFDNPQQSYQCIHIAGSKGKGSTATMIADILSNIDTGVGIYTSPHLYSYSERITILSSDESEHNVEKLIVTEGNIIYRYIEEVYMHHSAPPPTLFELLTLLAFCVFRAAGCNWAIIETGLGGRLDATNVVTPRLSIITSLELEHCNFLGNSIQEITEEKVGIIKQGRPVVYAPQVDAAERIIQARAAGMHAPAYKVSDYLSYSDCRLSLGGTYCTFTLDDMVHKKTTVRDVQLGLIGEQQCMNAMLALLAATQIFPWISFELLTQYLKHSRLPGRFDIISNAPPIICDTAHTPQSIRSLLKTFTSLYSAPGMLIFAASHDKQYAAMIEQLSQCFTNSIVTRPQLDRFTDEQELVRLFQQNGCNVEYIELSSHALQRAKILCPGGPILITGSSYLVAEIMYQEFVTNSST